MEEKILLALKELLLEVRRTNEILEPSDGVGIESLENFKPPPMTQPGDLTGYLTPCSTPCGTPCSTQPPGITPPPPPLQSP